MTANDRYGSRIRVDADAPREEEQERWGLEEPARAELEDSRVLEKELALLREEQREPREIDLLVVHLDRALVDFVTADAGPHRRVLVVVALAQPEEMPELVRQHRGDVVWTSRAAWPLFFFFVVTHVALFREKGERLVAVHDDVGVDHLSADVVERRDGQLHISRDLS